MNTFEQAQERRRTRRPLQLAAPSPKVKIGKAKALMLSRAQDLIESIGWLSIVWVVFTFLIDGGAVGVTDLQSALGAIERLSALVATDLLLIQTLLIARVPWLDKIYGHDRATHTHKRLGKPVLYLVILHFVAVVWSYAIADSKNVIDELFLMLNTTPDLVTGTIAFVLMIIVVLSSIKITRSRLSYEAWYLVHLLAYGAVMLAIPHQINVGTDIAGKPLAQVFWISAYLFVGLNILWFRLLSPIVLSGFSGLKISEVTAEASDATSVYISGRNLKRFQAKSGQFFILRIVTIRQWWRAHPFSLSAAPTNDELRFTIGNRGDDTALMQHLTPGTRVILEGPYGVFTEDRRTQDNVVLIAAGIGAPPIRALAENIAAKPGEVSIIYRVRDKSDAALADELQEIATVRGFYIHILDGSRRFPTSWLPKGEDDSLTDDERLVALCPKIAKSDVYICGPAAFTQTVEKSLKLAGTPANQIHAEEFAW
jgi:predicted ferric reductase